MSEDKEYLIGDDLVFPKATIDPKLYKLQKDVTEFVTSIILKHELDFLGIISQNFPDKIDDILCNTCESINEMIMETTCHFYNKIYREIQNKIPSQLSHTIMEMCECTNYGPHILLDKLFRLTLDAHLEVVREQLSWENNDSDLYQKLILNQVNVYLLSHNLLHILSKGPDEDIPFVEIPEKQNVFSIEIYQNMRKTS